MGELSAEFIAWLEDLAEEGPCIEFSVEVLAQSEQLRELREERDEALQLSADSWRLAWAKAQRDWQTKVDRTQELEQLRELRERAKAAKSQAAAPDYDEEAIRAALWAVVDLALEVRLAATEHPKALGGAGESQSKPTLAEQLRELREALSAHHAVGAMDNALVGDDCPICAALSQIKGTDAPNA